MNHFFFAWRFYISKNKKKLSVVILTGSNELIEFCQIYEFFKVKQ